MSESTARSVYIELGGELAAMEHRIAELERPRPLAESIANAIKLLKRRVNSKDASAVGILIDFNKGIKVRADGDEHWNDKTMASAVAALLGEADAGHDAAMKRMGFEERTQAAAQTNSEGASNAGLVGKETELQAENTRLRQQRSAADKLASTFEDLVKHPDCYFLWDVNQALAEYKEAREGTK